MSIETKYVCDVCGAVRGETNHWFVAGEVPGVPGAVAVNRWDAAMVDSADATHLCGQKCAHALLDRWLTTGKLEPEQSEVEV